MIIKLIVLSLPVLLLIINPVSAYIDPGTGASIIGSFWPMIIAFFAFLGGLFVKIFIKPLKNIVLRTIKAIKTHKKEFLNKKLLIKLIILVLGLFIISIFLFLPYKLDKIGQVERPNIIIITMDALRADHLGVYGYPYNTSPNIDNFAKDATIFKNAYSQAPWTIPSIATIFTSLYPSVHGITLLRENNLNYFYLGVISEKIKLIYEVLRSHGYKTVFISGNILLVMYSKRYIPQHSFDDVLISPEYNDLSDASEYYTWNSSNMTEAAINHLNTIKDKPFFLILWYMDPHAPYAPSEEFDIFNHSNIPELNRYDGEILSTDTSIGTFLTYLKENDLYNNSLIIFTSDHGEQFKDYDDYIGHSSTVREVETHVPFILKLPKNSKYKLNKIEEKPVGLIDIYPTILDLLEIKYPEYIQGRSIFEIINDNNTNYLFSEVKNKKELEKGKYNYVEEYLILDNELNSLIVSRSASLGTAESDFGTFSNITIIDLRIKGNQQDNITNSQEEFDLLYLQLAYYLIKNRDLYNNLSVFVKDKHEQIDPDTLEKIKSLGYLN
ncbi:MAG: sulfatase [Nanoarchaeota archaeon]